MQESKDPVISVVVIAYNIQDLVLETLDSIYNQSYPQIELIISDDCSTDQTVERCKKWLDVNRDRFVDAKIVIARKNGGIPANCNQGIKVSNGEWIKIIAGDDLFFQDAMEKFISYINQDSRREKKAFHADAIEFHDNLPGEEELSEWGESHEQQFNLPETSPEEQFNILIRFNPVHAPTVLLHRSIYEDIGYFDERFRFWEDRPMWLKITSHGVKMHYLRENIVKYRRHNLSVQFNSGTLFSRTLLSMDEGYKILIIKHMPIFEQLLYSYVINIRSMFVTAFRNKKTFLINSSYKALVYIPEMIIKKIKHRYRP